MRATFNCNQYTFILCSVHSLLRFGHYYNSVEREPKHLDSWWITTFHCPFCTDPNDLLKWWYNFLIDKFVLSISLPLTHTWDQIEEKSFSYTYIGQIMACHVMSSISPSTSLEKHTLIDGNEMNGIFELWCVDKMTNHFSLAFGQNQQENIFSCQIRWENQLNLIHQCNITIKVSLIIEKNASK